MDRPLWQLLMPGQDFTGGQEFTCKECFLVLEYYADLLASGATPDKLRSHVQHHLARCSYCREQFSQWLKDLESELDDPIV